MYKQTSGMGEMLAVGLAILTVVASAVVIYFYGTIKVVEPGLYGLSPRTKEITNWPVIVSTAVGAIYSVLFAILFCHVETTRNAVAKIANHFGIKEDDGATKSKE